MFLSRLIIACASLAFIPTTYAESGLRAVANKDSDSDSRVTSQHGRVLPHITTFDSAKAVDGVDSDHMGDVFAMPRDSQDVEVFIANAKLIGFFDFENDEVVPLAAGGGQCHCCGCSGPCSQCTPRRIRICCNSWFDGGGGLDDPNDIQDAQGIEGP
mmetsp:Transcript_7921/g.15897  ORF Transcript_7921/g.15897 Transcript_7921/m.15897 type:complete len:157 (+) Transcript_7921:1379-1849(+)